MSRTCYCCRSTYEHGAFICCAPPPGTSVRVWMGRQCETCKKCPRHCACEGQAGEPDAFVHFKQVAQKMGWTRPERDFTQSSSAND